MTSENEEETFDPNVVIGMAQDIAAAWLQKHGYRMRVVRKDGQACLTTRDFRTDRINVAVRDGCVYDVLSVG
jgi:hypothetical protein